MILVGAFHDSMIISWLLKNEIHYFLNQSQQTFQFLGINVILSSVIKDLP